MKNNKSKFQCSVYMGEEGINIYGEDDRVLSLLNGNFVPFIPEWRIEKQKDTRLPYMECVLDAEHNIRFEKPNNFFISGQFDDFVESSTIPYFVHYILESERAKQCKATIHAAAVSKNGKGFLILGKQGSGKTSITLELCRNHGYSLVGNDLVLVGMQNNTGYLYGGTKIFRIRATTVKDYNSDLNTFFKYSDSDEWTQIAVINPEEIDVQIEKLPTKIHGIYYVHLYPSNYNLLTKEVDRLFSRVFLYQVFSEYIRGSAIIPLVGKDLRFSDYIQSLDTKDNFQKRIKFINWIINNDNYKYVSGSLGDICSFINKNI